MGSCPFSMDVLIWPFTSGIDYNISSIVDNLAKRIWYEIYTLNSITCEPWNYTAITHSAWRVGCIIGLYN